MRCETTQRAEEPAHLDAATSGPEDRPTLEDASVKPPDAHTGFQAIEIERDACPVRAGIAFGSLSKVFVTTGCGFYSVDVAHGNAVVQLATRGDTVDDDGSTIAVIANQLGLSFDSGNTFTWTDWDLPRCQGSPQLTAGQRFAAIACVAGLGRWRGGVAAFEKLSPDPSAALIVPIAAASGSRLVVAGSDAWFVSRDGGDTFEPLALEGLPERVRAYGLEVVDTSVFVPVPLSEEETALFVRELDGGSFTRVSAFPSVRGTLSLNYHEGVLVVTNGERLLLSADRGASFVEVPSEGAVTLGAVAKYAAERLFVMSARGTLYVRKFVPSR